MISGRHPELFAANEKALQSRLGIAERHLNEQKGRQRAALIAKPWTKSGEFKVEFMSIFGL
jgi:hypothetical protein